MQNIKSGPKNPQDLGVFGDDKKIYIFLNLFNYKDKNLRIAVSRDGYNFKLHSEKPTITYGKKEENYSSLLNFKITKIDKNYFLVYQKTGKNKKSIIASSKDLVTWEEIGEIPYKETGMLLSGKLKDNYVLYFGEEKLKIAYSNDLKNWTGEKEILSPRSRFFDSFEMSILGVFPFKEGNLVFYSVKVPNREGGNYRIGAALFEKDKPDELIWRSEEAIWEAKKELKGKDIYPLGASILNDDLFLYFISENKTVYLVHFSKFVGDLLKKASAKHPSLKKHFKNPIIEPVIEHFWESQATFNPAAIRENGKTHFLYRAIGDNNISVLGYASSSDGINIDERLDEPAYIPREAFEYSNGDGALINYMSGGGYGGCEDPRLTKIGDRIYMTYVAFNGFDPPRVAFTSIKSEDFFNKKWNWEKPKIISKPGVVDKNAVLFPERINGKYTFLHRIFPNILIDFVDDLQFKNGSYLKGEYKIEPTANGWDSRKVGAGPPPIKTKDGWLLIYHAVDDKDDSKYKMGAMLLDLTDPSKVLYRTKKPMLEPMEKYENEGYKSGVAYPCGAVVADGILFVYYGGADKYVCVAHKNMEELIKELKSSGEIDLESDFKTTPIYKHHD